MTKEQFYETTARKIREKKSNYKAETEEFNKLFNTNLSVNAFEYRVLRYMRSKEENPTKDNRFNGVNDLYYRFCMEEMMPGTKDYAKGAAQYNDIFGTNITKRQFANRIYKYMKTHGFEYKTDENNQIVVTRCPDTTVVKNTENQDVINTKDESTNKAGDFIENDNQPKVYSRTEFSDGTIEVRDVIAYKDEVRGNKSAIMTFMGFNPEEWECTSMKESIWEGGKNGANRYSVQLKVKPRKELDFDPEKFALASKKVFEEIVIPSHKDLTGSNDNDFTPIGLELGTNKVVETDGLGNYRYVKNKTLNKEKLFLIPQIEAHLGKIANKIECTNVYNHEIVERRVKKVFEQVVEKQVTEKCATALIVIGGDFFNSESNYATTNGTPQTATDTRYMEMYSIGLRLYCEGIETLKQHFNRIDVLLCSGNHARAMEHFLYRALECYYSKDNKVCFKDDYHETQSYVFGRCGLFFNHGDVNQKRLVASIPCEFPDEWGQTRSRYLFCGHLHKLEVSNNENGLIFHRTPAICENDAWHYSNRFGIGVVPQHEIMVFDKACGMIADFNIYFNETR